MTYEEILRDARSSVGPGWWPIIDKYLPQMVELAPEGEFFFKEKFGTLRLRVYGKALEHDKLTELELTAERESETVCEECGNPGRLHDEFSWIRTLCDGCAAEAHKHTINLQELAERREKE